MANTSLFIQAKTGDTPIPYSALAVRKLVAATFPTEGILSHGQLAITPRAAGANMSVDVAAGGCVVKCDTVLNGGSYLEFEDATTNVTIPAAPGSGTRTHLIVEQVLDPQSDGQSSYSSAPICIPDGGAGAVMPQSALLLGRVVVTAGQSSVIAANITNVAPIAHAGAPAVIEWSDTASATIPAGLGHSGTVDVAFPTGLFPATPNLQLTAQAPGSNDNGIVPNCIRTASHASGSGIDSTGFGLVVHSLAAVSAATTIVVQYFATLNVG